MSCSFSQRRLTYCSQAVVLQPICSYFWAQCEQSGCSVGITRPAGVQREAVLLMPVAQTLLWHTPGAGDAYWSPISQEPQSL